MTHYQGDIWGSLPADYPTEQAERVYRALLVAIPAPSFPRDLIGYGLKGAAYRYRAMSEYQDEFEQSILSRLGAAPPSDEEFLQERCLFGFFASGLASLECISFSLHAAAAHSRPTVFKCDNRSLRSVSPESVAKALAREWPTEALAKSLGGLVADGGFRDWKELRNVLSHRMVPPRLIQLSSHSPTTSSWYLTKANLSTSDEPLQTITTHRRAWIAKQIANVWNAIEASLPLPP